MLPRIIRYKALVGAAARARPRPAPFTPSQSLIHCFTCGADEVRAWTFHEGTNNTAPQCAGA